MLPLSPLFPILRHVIMNSVRVTDVLSGRIPCVSCATQQGLVSVVLGRVVVTQQMSDLDERNLRIGSRVGETFKQKSKDTVRACPKHVGTWRRLYRQWR